MMALKPYRRSRVRSAAAVVMIAVLAAVLLWHYWGHAWYPIVVHPLILGKS